MPNGNGLSTAPGQFTDWTLGVNFSVPLGLRQARAAAAAAGADPGPRPGQPRAGAARRRRTTLATTLRNLDRAYEQYLAFKEARAAADGKHAGPGRHLRHRVRGVGRTSSTCCSPSPTGATRSATKPRP